jgi:broad specificity phosphatase PhoE
MSALLLVRHGQASFGSTNYDRLSSLGEEQVGHLRDHFTRSGQKVDAIYSGSLYRQRSTAEILDGTAGCGLATLPAFDEYDAQSLIERHAALTGAPLTGLQGSAATLDQRNFQRRLEAVGLAWVNGELDHPQLESWTTFRARVADGLGQIMAREGRSRDIVISTSAGVIGAAVAHVLGLDDHRALHLSWVVFNASVTRIRYDGTRCSLESFNVVSHLETQPEPRRLLTHR